MPAIIDTSISKNSTKSGTFISLEITIRTPNTGTVKIIFSMDNQEPYRFLEAGIVKSLVNRKVVFDQIGEQTTVFPFRIVQLNATPSHPPQMAITATGIEGSSVVQVGLPPPPYV